MTNLELLQQTIARMTSDEFAGLCSGIYDQMRLNISSVAKDAMGFHCPWCRDDFCKGRSCRDCLAEWLGEEKEEKK